MDEVRGKQAGAELSQAQASFPAKRQIWKLCLYLRLSCADLDEAIISCSLDQVDEIKLIR